ncbi:four helix bundle protein [Candidatus Gottesmanbacteria bacterium CG11_big_fil_rev_8_21_14_0_20_37_11]|uniref:Four helix bundle protein n=3 Tax=Candidatus Gottesmaniibacteriota TaxID=1752720 RepID=A0A2M7RQH9_9BACT|nr:MAG: four helix bundle protein [Candidatus Gottesmanbacteria bacterium CG1_02_37_22]PIP33217.1 MAG: four helix bundle protein [Candidatus Gottesmanbacteria bacterium CG23_combo_of_CG06-09_8_20_14_all_37_19]PIR07783.1 MAG: four helix bundle protein [Candidatus Gottesmanbacteria bacterium CG11_big_fil_rev_8_21_14_0_20_37_11]PIZ02576.1 MAG: four helix bundle protein [Candidatus Gottesmanbacteria bacterium CG_4_10_14_0_8_um_filter_37_24]
MGKVYDLEERTFLFAKRVAIFCKSLPRSLSNIEFGKQLIRSSSSVGANYIEANEALSKKDFQMRVKICRKEAKETAYWLQLILETNDLKNSKECQDLFREAEELKKIFSSMIK